MFENERVLTVLVTRIGLLAAAIFLGADRRVPLEHGKRMLSALKGHNSQVEWIEYEKEGHGWATIETQRDFWSRVDAFLAKNLKAP